MYGVQPQTPRQSPDVREVLVAVPRKVHARLSDLAKRANVTTSLYASQLLMAAYSARHSPTGDRDLDKAVARVVVLDAIEDTPVEDIASYVDLSVPTVKAIIKAWHAELAGHRSSS